MADTPTQTNINAASNQNQSNPTSQGGQPNETPDRGKSDGSKGDQYDRKPEQAGGADAMKNEGGSQPTGTVQNKGTGENEKGSAENKPATTEGR